MLRKWKISIGIALAIAALAVGGVFAADAVQQNSAGQADHRGQPVLGTITAIDGNQVTLRPEVPAWLAAKLTEKGVTLPPLPASVSFWIGADSKLYQHSAAASFSEFKVGDQVAARLNGDPQSGNATARSLSDDATAQQFVEGLMQKREARIARDGRPVMGKVLSIDGEKVTIQPERPQQLAAKLEQRGIGLPPLPESLSFTVGSDAVIVKENVASQLSAFQAGDEIGAMVKGDLLAGTASAAKFMDLASAKQLIQQKLGEARAKWQSGGGDAGTSPLHQLGNRVRGSGGGNEGGQAGPGGEGRGPGGEGRGGPGGGEGRGQRPMFGKIVSIGASKITVKPEIPDFIKQRMLENGRELPPLPDSLSFGFDGNTQFILNGQGAKAADFKVGDEIAAMLDGPARSGNAVALRVADVATAKQAFEKNGGKGLGGGREGGPGGPGGGHRPMFGTITSIDGNAVTIKPEVPDFIKQRMAAHGAQEGPGGPGGPQGPGGPDGFGGPGRQGGPGGRGGGRQRELPAQLTVSITSSTKFVQNSQPVSSDPFKAGDKVAIVPGGMEDGPRGEANLTAAVISDYASAEARMKDHAGKGQAGQGGRAGKRGGKAGRHGAGAGNDA